MSNRTIAILAAVVTCVVPGLVNGTEQPVELGLVQWERDFDAAQQRAQESGKPLFVLFQEVPGCRTCVDFGQSVLSSPLLVDAIEHEFVPVAIFNNEGGGDAEIVQRFNEPASNNPVVRFLSPKGEDLIPRRDGVTSAEQIGLRMIEALEVANRPVPKYLQLAVEETRAPFAHKATFSMDSYRRGEVCLAAVKGVLSTSTAVLQRREVVEVTFDPAEIDYRGLVEAVHDRQCANYVFAHMHGHLAIAEEFFGERLSLLEKRALPAAADAQKYYLRQSPLSDIELTPLQELRVNAAIAGGTDPMVWLSPRQRDRVDAKVLAAKR